MMNRLCSALRVGALGLTLLTLNGCAVFGGDRQIVLFPQEATIAVGAKHDLFIAVCNSELSVARIAEVAVTAGVITALGRIDILTAVPGALIPGCDPLSFEITGTSLDNPVPFDMVQHPDARNVYTLTALEEGDATVTFTLEVEVDGDTETHTVNARYSAREITAVDASIACATSAGVTRNEHIVPGSTRLPVAMTVMAGGETLNSWGYGYIPLEAAGVELLVESGDPGSMSVIAPDAGAFSFSSPSDPSFSREYEVYEQADFDALSILVDYTSAGPELGVGSFVRVSVVATIGGERPCLDTSLRRLVVETPETCELHEGLLEATISPGDDVAVHGTAIGTCRLRGELVGTGVVQRVEFEVAPGWERIDDPALDGLDAEALFSGGAGDLYVIGSAATTDASEGAIAYFDGTAWTRLDPAVSSTLRGAWSTGDGTTYFLGDAGTILAHDGSNFALVSTGVDEPMYAAWGSSADDIYAVGDQTLLHFDGIEWIPFELPVNLTSLFRRGRYRDVWGSADDDVYVLGPQGLAHYDGTGWTDVTPPSTPGARRDLLSIWGSAADDVWVATGLVTHWDGFEWTEAEGVVGSQIHGLGPGQIVASNAALFTYDGTDWEFRARPFNDIYASRLVAPGEMFVLSSEGELARKIFTE